MTGCPFCAIAAGTAAAWVAWEEDDSIAFLDRRPLFPGHLLLVPRLHVETLPDLPPQLVQPLFSTAQRLCRAVEEATGSRGTFFAINNRVSQSVPHLHLHIVPRTPKDGLRGFFWPRTKYPDEASAQAMAAAIAAAAMET